MNYLFGSEENMVKAHKQKQKQNKGIGPLQ